ncbi:MAG: D-2-hydroxyacid dehydrogenase [Propionibacteriaceae bacterium]|nr:D-2-hydroxyacid dehydrogenase [Propionibacteriaceae bacterium]
MSEELCARIESAEPRIELVRDQALLPPMRWAADHVGDPEFRRTPAQQEAFEALLDSADALYGIPGEDAAALARTVKANPRLRWVHTMAAGGGAQVKAAQLSQDDLSRVTFTTSAGVHGSSLAEFAVFGVLAGAKSLPRLLAQQARKEWSGRWCMKQLTDMTVIVAGLGAIGRQIASRLSALGVRVIGVNRPAADIDGVASVIPPERLAETIGQADALVVALPGTDATHKLVDAEVLKRATPGLIVVNVGRGTVIDEEALIEALDDGRVGFAALDVFYSEPLAQDSPLWEHPNVVVSPHTAGLVETEDLQIADLFVANATRLLDGEPMVNQVNTVEFY